MREQRSCDLSEKASLQITGRGMENKELRCRSVGFWTRATIGLGVKNNNDTQAEGKFEILVFVIYSIKKFLI
jgi:hypothetical protein